MSGHVCHVQIILSDLDENHWYQLLSNRMRNYRKCVAFSCKFQYEGSIKYDFRFPVDVKISHKYSIILVSDCRNDRIRAFDLHSKIHSFDITIKQPYYLAIDTCQNDEHLVVATTMGLYKYSLDTREMIWKIEQDVLFGTSFSVDSSKSTLIAFSQEMGIILFNSLNGKFKCSHLESNFNSPWGMDVSDDSLLVTTEWQVNDQVQIISNTHNTIFKREQLFGNRGCQYSQFTNMRGVCFDRANNNFLVCDAFNARIQVFTKECSFITSFGSKGKTNCSLNSPFGICVDNQDGTLYIADSANNRIQIFK